MRLFAVLSLALLAAACGGFDGSVSQKLELKGDDISGTIIADEHELDSDATNWNAFVQQAKGSLGHDPLAFSLASASLQIDAAKAKNVGKFEDVLKGECTLYVKTSNPDKITDVAKVIDPTGNGAVALEVLGADLGDQKDKLLKGDFKVGLRGTSVKAQGADFDLPLLVTLGVEAK